MAYFVMEFGSVRACAFTTVVALSVFWSPARGGEFEPLGPLQILDILKLSDFSKLETMLRARQNAFEARQIKESIATNPYQAFKNSHPAIIDPLNEWNKAFPNSYAALLARGVHRLHLAHTIRGDLWTRETPRERFARMAPYLTAADNDLNLAIILNPRLPAGYAALIKLKSTQGRL